MSEIERIIAIREQRELDDAIGLVKPTGTEPDSTEAKRVVVKFTPEYLEFLEQEHDTFTRMINKHTYESGDEVVCMLCKTDLSPEGHIGPPTRVEYLRLSPSDVRYHFEQEYGRGVKLAEKIRALAGGAECLIPDVQRTLNNCLHYCLFFMVKKALAKEQKQANREFRRIFPEDQKHRQLL
jgi:hypothetical protein